MTIIYCHVFKNYLLILFDNLMDPKQLFLYLSLSLSLTHTHTHTHSLTHSLTLTDTHLHTHLHTLTYTYSHLLTHTHTHMCVCVHARTHRHTHTKGRLVWSFSLSLFFSLPHCQTFKCVFWEVVLLPAIMQECSLANASSYPFLLLSCCNKYEHTLTEDCLLYTLV